MRYAGHVGLSFMGEIRNTCGKPEGKRLLLRPSRRWEDNIKTDLRELGFEVVALIHLADDRGHCRALVYTIMDLRVAKSSGEFLA
jgi:hypothetical protein